MATTDATRQDDDPTLTDELMTAAHVFFMENILGDIGRLVGSEATGGMTGDEIVAAVAKAVRERDALLAALKGLCDWCEATDADASVHVADFIAKARVVIAAAEGGAA